MISPEYFERREDGGHGLRADQSVLRHHERHRPHEAQHEVLHYREVVELQCRETNSLYGIAKCYIFKNP